MQNISTNVDVQKLIVTLVGMLLGSWGLFGFFIKRYLDNIDDDLSELYNRTNKDRIDITEIRTRCEERNHK